MKKNLRDIFKSMKEKNTNSPITSANKGGEGSVEKSKNIRIKNSVMNKRGTGGG